MKFTSFEIDGNYKYGSVSDGNILPASADFSQNYPDLKAAISSEMAHKMEFGTAIPLEKVKLLPPIPNPQKIICAGLNYNKKYPVDVIAPEIPSEPVVFSRFNDSLIGHGENLDFPLGLAGDTYDYEGEIVVVIGKPMWRASEADVKKYIFGFSIMNEGSVRGYQKHSVHAGKNFYRSGSWGPWIVSVSEAQPIPNMRLETRVNGVLKQSAYGDQMLFSVPRLLSYLSHLYPLAAGDIIATGSPEGSGGSSSPPKFLIPGDTVSVSVSSLGTLRNQVSYNGA